MAGENVLLRFDLESSNTFAITAAVARTKGDAWILNDMLVFALDDAAIDDAIGVCFDSEKALFPKTAGLAINEGDRVYWNDTTKAVTKTASQRAIGWCIETVAGGGSTVLIRFHQELESSTY